MGGETIGGVGDGGFGVTGGWTIGGVGVIGG